MVRIRLFRSCMAALSCCNCRAQHSKRHPLRHGPMAPIARESCGSAARALSQAADGQQDEHAMPKTAPQTLYDKIFEDHVVSKQPDGTCILYIDRHLVHEVTSPQAFEGLRLAGRKVRAPEKTLAVVDHNIATTADRNKGIKDDESRIQVETMAMNAKDFGIEYYDERDSRQGIVHVIGPEQGFTLPGTTIVCG